MQHTVRIIATLSAVTLLAACNNPFSKDSGLKTDTQKFSYSIGVDIAKSLEPIHSDIDLKALELGLKDGQPGGKLALDDKTRQEITQKIALQLRQKKQVEMDTKAKAASVTDAKFLVDNAKKAGVKTTPSGLQYEVLTEGTGAHPSATSVVKVNYKGTLTSGEVFDSSYDRGQPITFPLNQVIPGWTEGVQLMTAGSKYRFVIPSQLGYGPQGSGKIGPNAVLVFEVELLSIEK